MKKCMICGENLEKWELLNDEGEEADICEACIDIPEDCYRDLD